MRASLLAIAAVSVCVLLGIATASPAPHAVPPSSNRGEVWRTYRQQARAAYKQQDLATYRSAVATLHEKFPESARILLELAGADLRLGHAAEAIDWLHTYVSFGLVPNMGPSSLEQLKTLPKWTSVQRGIDVNSSVVHRSENVIALNDANLVAEDLTYQPSSRTIFVSSVKQGRILRCELSGQCKDFVDAAAGEQMGVWAVEALAADEARKTLWATTSALQEGPRFRVEDEGHSALLKLDLESGRLLGKYALTDAAQHAFGDMTVSRKGDVYVSDGVGGNVYVLPIGATELKPVAPVGVFYSPQTPALSRDESVLYVPDYVAGIAAIHLADGKIEWLEGTGHIPLDGIDGLCACGSELIAVQNGMSPKRVVRMRLSGRNIVSAEVLEANSQGLGEPTHAIVVGGDVFFIANSGWDRVGEKGELAPGTAPEVRRLRLDCDKRGETRASGRQSR